MFFFLLLLLSWLKFVLSINSSKKTQLKRERESGRGLIGIASLFIAISWRINQSSPQNEVIKRGDISFRIDAREQVRIDSFVLLLINFLSLKIPKKEKERKNFWLFPVCNHLFIFSN